MRISNLSRWCIQIYENYRGIDYLSSASVNHHRGSKKRPNVSFVIKYQVSTSVYLLGTGSYLLLDRMSQCIFNFRFPRAARRGNPRLCGLLQSRTVSSPERIKSVFGGRGDTVRWPRDFSPK